MAVFYLQKDKMTESIHIQASPNPAFTAWVPTEVQTLRTMLEDISYSLVLRKEDSYLFEGRGIE